MPYVQNNENTYKAKPVAEALRFLGQINKLRQIRHH